MPLAADEVGRRIREARLAYGWTNEEFARRVGVSWRTVVRWQKGQLPRLSRLVRLAEVFDLPQGYFVQGAESPSLGDIQKQLADLAERIELLAAAIGRLEHIQAGKGRAGDRRSRSGS